jgi:cysteinyl-tRNA synthetase
MNLDPPPADEAVEELIQMREQARKAREWDKADDLRQKLREMGIEVVDSKEGPLWRKD